VRQFVERMRAGSGAPVEYVELPGAHHDFDLYESIRSAAINVAVESFIERSGPNALASDRASRRAGGC
jgi:acetyl esterase/lipase